MQLGKYISSLPRGQRQDFREKLAKAHCVSVGLVRMWENSPAPEDWDAEKVSKQSRKHPPEILKVEITEQMTGGAVHRSDLRPDCFKRSET
ncbi:TPA: hypothetical protein ACGW3M_001211 [Pseudomonas aeruginosa]|nr:hypothetical protein [Pseudomonas aeruginosa]ELJ2278103.1 hypothetical protein [Pseudomonas aeruginosa]